MLDPDVGQRFVNIVWCLVTGIIHNLWFFRYAMVINPDICRCRSLSTLPGFVPLLSCDPSFGHSKQRNPRLLLLLLVSATRRQTAESIICFLFALAHSCPVYVTVMWCVLLGVWVWTEMISGTSGLRFPFKNTVFRIKSYWLEPQPWSIQQSPFILSHHWLDKLQDLHLRVELRRLSVKEKIHQRAQKMGQSHSWIHIGLAEQTLAARLPLPPSSYLPPPPPRVLLATQALQPLQNIYSLPLSSPSDSPEGRGKEANMEGRWSCRQM